MLRLISRVTLGSSGRDEVSADNFAQHSSKENLASDSQADELPLNQFDNAAHQEYDEDEHLNSLQLEQEPVVTADFPNNSVLQNEEEEEENAKSRGSSDSEQQLDDNDTSENLLVKSGKHLRGQKQTMIVQKRHNQIRSRKRHVVASTNGFQLSYHHPTIQAKQNQMYLITTLLPNETSQNEQNLINQILPKELVLRVFSHLDVKSLCRCAQVCRYWNVLAMDGSNWQDVDLFRYQKDIKAAVVENLARRCGGFLKNLSLRGCENVQDSALRSFALKCPNIERLWLNKCKRVTDDTSEYLGQYCHRLVTLDLENCTQITDKTLKFISQGCKHLEELNISWCRNITDKGIRMIAENCPKLRVLICKGCEGLAPPVFAQLNSDNLNELRVLNLLSCNLTDDTVEDVTNHTPNLEHICLSNCREITDRSLIAIAQNCPNIKDIELALCSSLTDTGFVALAKNCHNIERMDLEDCNQITDMALQCLNVGCPNLSSLSLSHCELLTDSGLSEFCSSHRDIIRVLELDNCPLITDASFEFMRPMPTLERVDLYDCPHISKEAIKRFKELRPEVEVQAYFAPITPPTTTQPPRQNFCRCCSIL